MLNFFLRFLVSPQPTLADPAGSARYLETLLDQSLSAVKYVLESPKYWTYSVLFSQTSEEEHSRTKQHLKDIVFTPDAVKGLVLTIVNRVFALTQEELQEWNDDPERYAMSSVSPMNSMAALRVPARATLRSCRKRRRTSWPRYTRSCRRRRPASSRRSTSFCSPRVCHHPATFGISLLYDASIIWRG